MDGTTYSRLSSPPKPSQQLKTSFGLPVLDAADQLAQVAAQADEVDLVPVLAQRVGHLVFHLRLGDVDASPELVFHLLEVLVMAPSGRIGRIEDDGDAKWHCNEVSEGIAVIARLPSSNSTPSLAPGPP